MPSINDPRPTDSNERDDVSPAPWSVQSVDKALDEIDHILRQMLLLAELSASDGAMDRDSLQQTLEHLQSKIDQIADII